MTQHNRPGLSYRRNLLRNLGASPLWLIGCLLMAMGCGASDTNAPSQSSAAPLTFSPISGPVGTVVTITGADFSTIHSVSIGGAAAIPLSRSTSVLVVMTMPGSTSGPVSVTTDKGPLTSSGLFTVSPTGGTIAQQGPKLVGTVTGGGVGQGVSVALSADGTTAVIGGPYDVGQIGGAWVWTRTSGIWAQQGPKLVGTGAVDLALQGFSVAVSADGTTAVIGGPGDNGGIGAAWVFTRTGTSWTQQGPKLVGTDANGQAGQGASVALSADGATAVIGGRNENQQVTAWVWTRTSEIWTQQGPKLIGTNAVPNTALLEPFSVAVSADGMTALIGGPEDNELTGAIWVFARMGTTWAQQGQKLVGLGATGQASQGGAVAVSADGTTAVIGGPGDNGGIGAAWVFTRTGTTWTQQGPKLVGTGAAGQASQGFSVAVSADGSTSVIGGPGDNGFTGAGWVWTRTGTTWTQQGPKLVGTGAAGQASRGFSVAVSANGTTVAIGGPDDNKIIGAAWLFAR
ncbi:MAG: IPT/TIG domain-containing protein [Nitrospira sp.]|nr:IPT/TIG domain-containing protein [Nitrospira sp.]